LVPQELRVQQELRVWMAEQVERLLLELIYLLMVVVEVMVEMVVELLVVAVEERLRLVKLDRTTPIL
jgi:hypothetical protein